MSCFCLFSVYMKAGFPHDIFFFLRWVTKTYQFFNVHFNKELNTVGLQRHILCRYFALVNFELMLKRHDLLSSYPSYMCMGPLSIILNLLCSTSQNVCPPVGYRDGAAKKVTRPLYLLNAGGPIVTPLVLQLPHAHQNLTPEHPDPYRRLNWSLHFQPTYQQHNRSS